MLKGKTKLRVPWGWGLGFHGSLEVVQLSQLSVHVPDSSCVSKKMALSTHKLHATQVAVNNRGSGVGGLCDGLDLSMKEPSTPTQPVGRTGIPNLRPISTVEPLKP